MNVDLESLVQSEVKDRLGLHATNAEILFSYNQDGVEIKINCDSHYCVEAIQRDRLLVSQNALKFNAKLVNLSLDGKTIESFPPRYVVKFNDRRKKTVKGCTSLQRSLKFDTWDDLKRLTKQNPNLKIVQFEVKGNELFPGTGLFSGANCAQTSGLTIDQWQGRGMDEAIESSKLRTWSLDQWQRFSQDLLTHGFMTDYHWKARLYTGEECEFTGDVRLILLPPKQEGGRIVAGRLGRMVEVRKPPLVIG